MVDGESERVYRAPMEMPDSNRDDKSDTSSDASGDSEEEERKFVTKRDQSHKLLDSGRGDSSRRGAKIIDTKG